MCLLFYPIFFHSLFIPFHSCLVHFFAILHSGHQNYTRHTHSFFSRHIRQINYSWNYILFYFFIRHLFCPKYNWSLLLLLFLHPLSLSVCLCFVHPFPAKGFLLFCKCLNRPRQCDHCVCSSLVRRTGYNYINSFLFPFVMGENCTRCIFVCYPCCCCFFRFALQK